MVGVEAGAQATPQVTSPGSLAPTGQPHGGGKTNTPSNKAVVATAQKTPACAPIIKECKTLGFVVGQWKTDNGLWKDCFTPVVSGKGSATRDGQPVTVPVSPQNVQACKAAVFPGQ
jgi:hypothetical protein